MRFFDSHIHLNSGEVRGWESEEDWIFNNVSVTLEDFRVAVEQSLSHPHVYVTAGVHPLEIEGLDLREAMEELASAIARHRDRIIAVGETGLDFYRGDRNLDFERQRRWLYAQYELAKRYDLPLVLHVRNAHEEMLELLGGIMDWYGVIHCFEGDEETMGRYLELPGEWMLSVSPIVMRKTSRFRNLIHRVDVGRLLVESDAPFLAPDHRGVPELIGLIAEEKGMNFEECRAILWDNFCRCFKLKGRLDDGGEQ